jgi:hypothetical protein
MGAPFPGESGLHHPLALASNRGDPTHMELDQSSAAVGHPRVIVV